MGGAFPIRVFRNLLSVIPDQVRDALWGYGIAGQLLPRDRSYARFRPANSCFRASSSMERGAIHNERWTDLGHGFQSELASRRR